jgi:ATP-dependent Clp protease protease subunit
MGMAASMAAVLLTAGTKGKRHVLPNARVMIHQPSSGTQGKVTDQEITLKEAIELKERLAKMMAKNTGQKLAKVKADMERDFWMSAEEAVEYGVVDKVITRE